MTEHGTPAQIFQDTSLGSRDFTVTDVDNAGHAVIYVGRQLYRDLANGEIPGDLHWVSRYTLHVSAS